MADGPIELARELDPERRKLLKIEVIVLLGVAVLPDLITAIVSLLIPWPNDDPTLLAFFLVSRSTYVIACVLYLMWRSGDGWDLFGIRRFRSRDLLAALGLYVVAETAVLIALTGGGEFQFGFSAMPQDAPEARPAGALEWAVVALGCAANGAAEELAITGFLLTRLERFWGSALLALLAAALLAASYHAYQGFTGVVGAFVVFATFGLWFVATRRIWPVVIAHALMDLMLYVIW